MKSKSLFSGILLVACVRLAAWDMSGHMLVAKIAYDNLNPHARAKLKTLAKKITFAGHTYNAVNIAAWADQVKHAKPADEPFAEHFANWHFIDLGLNAGDPDLLGHPPVLTERDGTIVEALTLCESVIHDHIKSDLVPNEAVAVALMVHLIGDLHQPLHCTSNYYVPKPATGKPHDGGGNAVTVTNFKDQYAELHQFWDKAYKMNYDSETETVKADDEWDPFSIKPSSQQLDALVAEILDENPPKPVSLSGDYYKTWALETHNLGKTEAYGALHQNYDHHSVTIDETYEMNAKKIAHQQLALAGWRLAAVLNKLYP